MFNTIAYCLGFSSNGLSPIENPDPVEFITKDADDHWTLVDIDHEDKCEVYQYPTPPPSPKLEQSWLVTPPPCFNAEDNQDSLQMLSSRENLLIEHPSMFVCPNVNEDDTANSQNNDTAAPTAVVHKHKGIPTTLRRSQRRAARQAASVLSQQNRRRNNQQFKHTNSDVGRRNNKGFQKMRQIVQQPRKRC
ncbi:uncharacterized protein LOC143468823 isoform X1 [Clavelina lepadiformis]|uniref:uncharacterized protein LOC143468823 isoform X1 n=1 Tax=Clavelina lepadiformis TaxID=159417 RepID=UPI004042C8ED